MVTMETLVSLCKRRGFVFQSSEIYGGTGSCWDYGPLGVELKNKANRARHALPPHPRHVGLRRIRETVTTTVASLPEQRPPLKVRAGVTPG
jgi:hypothetical protein